MEDLTKQQIVLVTLLVSFVTSIATGIVTVALMQQAPPEVAQTINRIVEKTIERVVQVPAESQQAAVITKETVVVKADDAVVDAIEKNAKSLVRLVALDASSAVSGFSTIGLGLVIDKSGLLVADGAHVMPPGGYQGQFAGGKNYPLELVYTDKENSLILMRPKVPQAEIAVFSPGIFADSDALKLGQTVIFIGGVDSSTVETGLISNLKRAQLKEPASTTTAEILGPVTKINTNLRYSEGTGGVLSNLNSEIIGFEVLRDSFMFLPSNTLLDMIDSYASSTKETVPGKRE